MPKVGTLVNYKHKSLITLVKTITKSAIFFLSFSAKNVLGEHSQTSSITVRFTGKAKNLFLQHFDERFCVENYTMLQKASPAHYFGILWSYQCTFKSTLSLSLQSRAQN